MSGPGSNRGPLTYANTNRLLKSEQLGISPSARPVSSERRAAASSCRPISEAEEISIVLLNSYGKLTPYGDSNRLRKWMLAQS